MLLTVYLKMQTVAKSGPLKYEGKSALFSAPCDAQESANGTTRNALAGTIEGASGNIPGSAIKMHRRCI